MTTHNNADPLEGWTLPPRVITHCGDIVTGLACQHCGEWIDPTIRHIDETPVS